MVALHVHQRKRRALTVNAAAVAATLAMGCSAQSDLACDRAAWAQADAELRFNAAVTAHNDAHESGVDHDDSTRAARVEMILAEAETRRRCG